MPWCVPGRTCVFSAYRGGVSARKRASRRVSGIGGCRARRVAPRAPACTTRLLLPRWRSPRSTGICAPLRTIPSPIPCRRATHLLHPPAFAAATTSKLLLVVAVEGKSEKESRAWWWSLLERLSVNQMTRLSLAWPVHLLRRGACPRSSGRRHPVPPHTYRMHRSLIEC
jgi:hypothetical protein